MMRRWKVVPICKKQMLDVRKEDLLNDGDFRKCNIYRAGGGYDQFPYICYRRMRGRLYPQQFVVQLYGCPLDCYYCYVTKRGIWGRYKPYRTSELIAAFIESGQDVFHLMGGAPALYLKDWAEIVENIPERAVFHSDLLLIEKAYKRQWLEYDNKNVLLAIDIKGTNLYNFEINTRSLFKEKLFWNNLDVVVDSNVSFYLTFTNPDDDLDRYKDILVRRYGDRILDDCFTIDLIQYNACDAKRWRR